MANTNATEFRNILVDMPDFPGTDVEFWLLTRFAANGTEAFPKKKYVLTLNANGQGTQALPVPSSDAWLWRVVTPDGKPPYNPTLAAGADLQLTTWLASAQSTVTAASLADQFAGLANFDAHVADTTAVHGIADTSALETAAGAQAKADAAEAASEPDLGNPLVDGHVLKSTIAGVRSWGAGGSGGDVGDLTTTGLTAANMLRVAAVGGVEERTPAQVLSDIGAVASSALSAAPTAAEPLKADGSGGIRFGGKLSTGGNAPSADDSSISVGRAVGDTVNSHGVRDESVLTASTPATGYAAFDAQYIAGGTAAYNHIGGFQARMVYNGAGTLTTWRGYYSLASIQGPVTDIRNYEVFNASKSGAGTIANQYGLFVNALSGATYNWAIYTMPSTPSWFSGPVHIGFNANTNGSVTATGHSIIRALTGGGQMQWGWNSTSNFGWVQTAVYGTAWSPLVLNANGGGVIVGNAGTPGGALHVDQAGSSEAVPVLYLDQADVSEEIFEIASTAGVGNAIELVGAKTLTPTEFIKVTINGNTRYIAAGTIA